MVSLNKTVDSLGLIDAIFSYLSENSNGSLLCFIVVVAVVFIFVFHVKDFFTYYDLHTSQYYYFPHFIVNGFYHVLFFLP